MFNGTSFPVGVTLCSLTLLHYSQMNGRVVVIAPPEPVTRTEYFLLT